MRRVVAVDKLTGDLKATYGSVKEAAAAHGFNRKTLPSLMAGKALQHGMTVLRYEEDYDPREPMAGKANAPVVIFAGGKPCAVAPSQEAAQELSMSSGAVSGSCRRGSVIDGEYMVTRVPRMGWMSEVLCGLPVVGDAS